MIIFDYLVQTLNRTQDSDECYQVTARAKSIDEEQSDNIFNDLVVSYSSIHSIN